MEIEEPIADINSTPLIEEPEVIEKDIIEEESISLDQTIQVENSALKPKDNEKETPEVTSNQDNPSENGKKKAKEEKPPSKIVVRRLPPTMTKDQFLEQVSPLPEVDYMYYVQGDVNNTINPFSRAYLNFVNQEDLFSFSRTFDNYVFLDAKGQEYPAIVEFAMFQRVPKQRVKKKDPLIGTIEADPAFITFKENLLAEALENSKPGGKAIKQHYFETEISATEEVNTTPLLEFLKVRRAEKARIREERREEKKRKEVERKLKQKTKDKKGDVDEEELSKDVKIQPNQTDKNEAENNKNKKNVDKEIVGKSDADESITEPVVSNQSPDCAKKILILKSAKSDKNQNASFDNMRSKSGYKTSKSVINTKCDKFISNNPKMGKLVQKVEELKIKEAEQQTQYLRKMLGLLSNENPDKAESTKTDSTSSPNSSAIKVCIPKDLVKVEPPEEVLSAFKEYITTTKKKDILWSKHNINPALPSASFKSVSSSSSNCGDSSAEQRSLSAPRHSTDDPQAVDGGLGRQVASSTPNVSLEQVEPSQKVFHVSRLMRKNESYSDRHPQPPQEEVLPSKERRDTRDRDSRNAKKKEEKEKLKESRIREFKSRGGKSYQEERLKLAERREELKKKDQPCPSEKTDAGDANEVSENTDPSTEQVKNSDEKPARVEKKRYENRKGNKYDNEDWKDDTKKRNRVDKNSRRDGRDRKDEYSRRKNGEADSRRKHKGYKDSRPEKKKSSSNNDQEDQETKKPEAIQSETAPAVAQEENDVTERKTRSYDDLTVISVGETDQSDSKAQSDSKKRCSSLESGRSENNTSNNELMDEVEKIVLQKKEKVSKSSRQSESSSTLRSRKDLSNKKSFSEDKNISSNKKEKFDHSEEGKEKEEQALKTSSQENSAGSENSSSKSKESTTRAERRIRNKDRPSIEIYRPGMGKFSKQRLEKEKALGSSTEVESPSHSPSPTPKSKLIT